MDWIFSAESWMALVTLTVLEIVLGIGNICFHDLRGRTRECICGAAPNGQNAGAQLSTANWSDANC